MYKNTKPLFTGLFLCLWLIVACGTKDTGVYTVKKVIDGDTFVIAYRGKEEKVRLIGVNAPETKHSPKGEEYYGEEAKLWLMQRLSGEQVTLQWDVKKRDKYGRLLAYVFLADGTFVNEELVAEGMAYAKKYPPNTARQDELTAAEDKARTGQRGMWKSRP